MIEIWKKIKGYEKSYQISNLGRVKSTTRKYRDGKILKLKNHKKGYKEISLCLYGIKKCFKVHRLVALTFIPNPDNKLQVNHLNCIKDDNCVENLEWATGLENIRHALDNNLICGLEGELNGKSKIKNKDAEIIRFLYSNKIFNQIELAAKYKIHQTAISRIVLNKTYK